MTSLQQQVHAAWQIAQRTGVELSYYIRRDGEVVFLLSEGDHGVEIRLPAFLVSAGSPAQLLDHIYETAAEVSQTWTDR